MPVTARKNRLYGAALPLLGKRCRWRQAQAQGGGNEQTRASVERAWKRRHAVGACVQVIRAGQVAETYTAGFAALTPSKPVRPDTVFRTASVAKAVCALLVMRLQTIGRLSVEEDISDFWHRKLRNPAYPNVPIPLGSLLSHTSGMVDSPLYFRSFAGEVTVDTLLSDAASFSAFQPYARFRYSNFAAGLIGSLLEERFKVSIEALMQRELFEPLGVTATFDIRRADLDRAADSYRVLPPGLTPTFDARKRFAASTPVDAPDPQRHFLLASGNLYITAGDMARLCLVMMDGTQDGKPFLNETSLRNLRMTGHAEAGSWQGMRHGMGLLALEDPAIAKRRLYGHQGFAYGAVNGFFFDERGNGFVSFNSGASEQRVGRLSVLNRDLIGALLPEDGA